MVWLQTMWKGIYSTQVQATNVWRWVDGHGIAYCGSTSAVLAPFHMLARGSRGLCTRDSTGYKISGGCNVADLSMRGLGVRCRAAFIRWLFWHFWYQCSSQPTTRLVGCLEGTALFLVLTQYPSRSFSDSSYDLVMTHTILVVMHMDLCGATWLWVWNWDDILFLVYVLYMSFYVNDPVILLVSL